MDEPQVQAGAHSEVRAHGNTVHVYCFTAMYHGSLEEPEQCQSSVNVEGYISQQSLTPEKPNVIFFSVSWNTLELSLLGWIDYIVIQHFSRSVTMSFQLCPGTGFSLSHPL